MDDIIKTANIKFNCNLLSYTIYANVQNLYERIIQYITCCIRFSKMTTRVKCVLNAYLLEQKLDIDISKLLFGYFVEFYKK